MVPVESDTSSIEEWKSLNNPKSRMLFFFQILQSYLDRREGQAEGRKMHMVEDVDSNLPLNVLDKYSKFLYSSIYDVE
ncbi:hypothetical protein Baya_4337 [Bagarius yarrelli]|uniref:Uncharacterized protein n=1 Tax=Bagarius yarrelli TaxID=175774 RepID=A0A556TPV9_BAGYA|nr:hypothetical protein Baya_4337 [Bagarius yarrelli]